MEQSMKPSKIMHHVSKANRILKTFLHDFRTDKKFIGLLLYTPILLFYYYISKRYDTIYEQSSTSEAFENLKRYGKYYLTGWNFSCQTYFLVVALLDEIAILTPILANFRRIISLVRHYIFTAVIFPVGVMVSTLFWILYAIDRELVFPKSLDEYYSDWMTHSVHSFILLPLMIEIFLARERKAEDVDFWRTLPALAAFLLAYQISFFYVYFRYNVWLYPICQNLSWLERMCFMLALDSVTVCFLYIGICVQHFRRKIKYVTSREE